jgi:crossover junction endodeoxyribonuclease RusA
MAIRFPFPDRKLSANSRIDRRYVTKEREMAREIGFWLTKDAHWEFDGKLPLALIMLIRPPDKRRRDNDNIITAFKSYRDGMFKALGLDDSLIKRMVIEFGEIEKDGAIYVDLKEIQKLVEAQ